MYKSIINAIKEFERVNFCKVDYIFRIPLAENESEFNKSSLITIEKNKQIKYTNLVDDHINRFDLVFGNLRFDISFDANITSLAIDKIGKTYARYTYDSITHLYEKPSDAHFICLLLNDEKHKFNLKINGVDLILRLDKEKRTIEGNKRSPLIDTIITHIFSDKYDESDD